MSAARRPGRGTNLALLCLLAAALTTGVLAYGTGTPGWATAIAIAHGAAGLAILTLVPWKSVIVRRGLRRGSTGRHVVGALLGGLVLLAVAGGVGYALTGYHPVLGVTALGMHVGAGALAVPLLAAHAWGRRQRPRRLDLQRRNLLRAAGVTAGSVAAYGGVYGLARALGHPSRPTGSVEAGSGVPAAMPVTQWFTDPVPVLDAASWSVAVAGRSVAYADLAAGTDTVHGVLDCTGGWYAEQEWRGVRLDRLISPPPGARSVDVVSETGYRRRLPAGDLQRLYLVTHVAGAPLSAGHGGPVRLVAPGRRGFWWVKWVRSVQPSAEPWWAQSPFPLQ
ncbi:MAG: molybdopterin-dependent oxidoreductase [Mycobacteriales bacterium]